MAQVLHSRLKIVLDHNSSARWSAFQIRKIAKVLNWQAGRTKYDRIKQLTTGRADCEAFCFICEMILASGRLFPVSVTMCVRRSIHWKQKAIDRSAACFKLLPQMLSRAAARL